MRQRERMARNILRGELMGSESLCEAYEELGGDAALTGRAARAEWLIDHVDGGELERHFDFEHVRFCTHCGHPMCRGYCVNGGCEYYCSRECLNRHYSDSEYRRMYCNGCSDTYYTSWID